MKQVEPYLRVMPEDDYAFEFEEMAPAVTWDVFIDVDHTIGPDCSGVFLALKLEYSPPSIHQDYLELVI